MPWWNWTTCRPPTLLWPQFYRLRAGTKHIVFFTFLTEPCGDRTHGKHRNAANPSLTGESWVHQPDSVKNVPWHCTRDTFEACSFLSHMLTFLICIPGATSQCPPTISTMFFYQGWFRLSLPLTLILLTKLNVSYPYLVTFICLCCTKIKLNNHCTALNLICQSQHRSLYPTELCCINRTIIVLESILFVQYFANHWIKTHIMKNPAPFGHWVLCVCCNNVFTLEP